MLTSRMVDILKAIVDEYVSTAEPVGSETLKDKYDLNYSSATIRNDMAQLEALGYLEKPHTSAGRVPSNKGYQFYCENLLRDDVDQECKNAIANIFANNSMNVEDALKESCKMISDMTNLTSGMLGPDASVQTLEYIQVFPLDSKNAVCVFVTNNGHTENKIFSFNEDVTAEDIKKCTDILNERLKGTLISELESKLTSLKPILVQSVKRYEMLFNAFLGAFAKFASEKLYINGASNMMYQPEFADIERLKELVKVFNSPKLLKQLSMKKDDGTDVTAIAPKGTELLWKDDMAIVTSKIKLGKDEKDDARIMVVGPRRMEYNRVISLVDFVAKQIEEIYK